MTNNSDMNEENKKTAGRPKQEVTLDKKQEIRCTEDEKAQWLRAAKSQNMKVSAWARELLNKAAKGH
ncbi:hypothetical protein KCG43_20305 [Photobacterium sp. WH24]|uniref:hypothetical protein n=1 Tax=Photobacterium sp. WH24 TaxID=2827237 RepID=UPI001C4873AF|nr:hypothetical protein [Photobacterium sp. WH24]MBV7264357.1 hypothetical protein [Photobacterium sp. WH24]